MTDIQELLKGLAIGKRQVIVRLSNFHRPVKAEVTGVDLRTGRTKVSFLESLSKTTKEAVENEGIARISREVRLVDVTRPYTEDTVGLNEIQKFI